MSNILIVGGQLHNKGSQAMIFTVIDEIRRRNLKQNIILLSSSDFKRSEIEKKDYNFSILPYNRAIKYYLLGGFWNLLFIGLKFLRKDESIKSAPEVKSAYQDADLILNVSGYGLSRQWPWRRSMQYLMNIKVAKKYGIPIYLLPQSFGPFNYKNLFKRMILYFEMKKYLSYPKLIFAREEEGYNELSDFTKLNLRKSLDIVLQREKKLDLNNIFTDPKKFNNKEIIIKESSVAIIPNEKLIRHGDNKKVYDTYYKIIEALLLHNKSVYILVHSSEDKKICQKIKAAYQSNDNVISLEDELNCFEMEDILAKFEFIVASRYHSIIHTYKSGIPVIALGWATKYKELLGEFNQARFCFDIRQDFNPDDVIESVNRMLQSHKEEHETIDNVRKKYSNNAFELIFEEL